MVQELIPISDDYCTHSFSSQLCLRGDLFKKTGLKSKIQLNFKSQVLKT